MKLLFVHIPKTGGSSILDKIDQSIWKKTMFAGHDPFFVLEKNNNLENTFSFCVVRDPYERSFSYFNHFKRQNNVDVSFIDFLTILKRKEYYKNTPFMVFPQSFFIYNEKGQIGVNKIYKFEKFYEIEEDLGLKFETLNKGNYTQEEYKGSLTAEAINLIEELFYIDFDNFEYNFL